MEWKVLCKADIIDMEFCRWYIPIQQTLPLLLKDIIYNNNIYHRYDDDNIHEDTTNNRYLLYLASYTTRLYEEDGAAYTCN